MKPRTTASRTKNDFRPRATAALAIAPVVVTDLTCAAVVGLEPRHFREMVYALKIPHVDRGRRMVVLVADFTKAIEQASIPSASVDHEDASGSADELLARLGRRRSA